MAFSPGNPNTSIDDAREVEVGTDVSPTPTRPISLGGVQDCRLAMGSPDPRTRPELGRLRTNIEHDQTSSAMRSVNNPSATSFEMPHLKSSSNPTGNRMLYNLPDSAATSPSSPEVSSRPPLTMSPSASALIFERDVQEDVTSTPSSPAIPSHIRTENYIPPVLEASSAAITDNYDPDFVEVVTHNIHQLAAMSIPGTAFADKGYFVQDGEPHLDESDDIPPTYTLSDTAGIRRLSFVSFADVVNSEHAQSGEFPAGHDYFHIGELAAGTTVRSLSPLRSPISSHDLGSSPPTSVSASFNCLELSPTRACHTTGSPSLFSQRPGSPSLHSDVNIETLGQTLRRTGSLEFKSGKSQVSSLLISDDVLEPNV